MYETAELAKQVGCLVPRKGIAEKIVEQIGDAQKRLEKMLELKKLLEKNPDIEKMLNIMREINIF